ncbi:MAG: DNA starvation/stationary phase protection protein [Bacteroidetes bacterium]|nr:DNA starvation/stationary phase protection protein [Bacteroidota bacterium]
MPNTLTAPTKAPARNGTGQRHALHWTPADRRRVTDTLNVLLANYQVHYQKLRNYHWNVKGSDFFDLHEQLEAQYQEAQANIDRIAERVRVFQERPLSTFTEYLEQSTVKEDRTVPASDKMVQQILADYTVLLDHLSEAVDLAEEMADAGTETMVKGFIQQIEKHHWMLSAFKG